MTIEGEAAPPYKVEGQQFWLCEECRAVLGRITVVAGRRQVLVQGVTWLGTQGGDVHYCRCGHANPWVLDNGRAICYNKCDN